MRFVVAIIAFVAAAILLSLGIAQRTVWLGPDTHQASAELGEDAAVAVVSGEVLNSFDGKQTLDLLGSGPLFAAYGRTADINAWVGGSAHYVIGYDEETQQLTSELIRGVDSVVPNPAGSDLWLDEFQQEYTLRASFTLPSNTSLILASNGTDSPASSVTLSWPRDNSTPFAGPLILAGILAALVGLMFYLSAMIHLRKARGPRRRTPKPPKPLKASKAYAPSAALGAGPSHGRRSIRQQRSIVLGALALTPALLLGCSTPPKVSSAAQPASAVGQSTEVEVPAAPSVAVSDLQLSRILAKIKTVADEADAAADADLIAERFAGPALEQRRANYTIRKASRTSPAPEPIPAGAPVFLLPEQTETWPRTVMAVVTEEGGGESSHQVMLVLVQEDVRANYKVHYVINLVQSLPSVASADQGARRLDPNLKLIMLEPSAVASAYGDVLLNGEKSDYTELFSDEADTLRTRAGADFKAQRKRKITNARMNFSLDGELHSPVALSTSSSGALVAAYLVEYERVIPSNSYSEIKLTGQTASLLGKRTTMSGLTTGYGTQLLFYIPVDDSDEPIKLLGYNQNLVSAKEEAKKN